MQENITRFLEQQTCATICCVDKQSKPYCFNCFYALNDEDSLLYFKSSADTHHAVLMKSNPNIAGTVLPDKLSKLIVKGVQLEGELLDPNHPLSGSASVYYYKKHPMSLAVPGEVWTIKINSIKMTDSTLGFGKKTIWQREEMLVSLTE